MVKRRIALALLGFAALWPLAHRALVAAVGADPWKLAGFAMYARPTLPVLVGLFVPADGRLALVEEDALPADVRLRLDRFRRERVALGSLREPDDLARALLDVHPDAAGVTIVVQRTDLDPRSARTVAHRDWFTYDRGAFAPE